MSTLGLQGRYVTLLVFGRQVNTSLSDFLCGTGS